MPTICATSKQIQRFAGRQAAALSDTILTRGYEREHDLPSARHIPSR